MTLIEAKRIVSKAGYRIQEGRRKRMTYKEIFDGFMDETISEEDAPGLLWDNGYESNYDDAVAVVNDWIDSGEPDTLYYF
jgi:hypothetical protein